MALQAVDDGLRLEGDVMPPKAAMVDSYLADWAGQDGAKVEVAGVIRALLEASRRLAARIAEGALPGDPGLPAGSNTDGDTQKRIDVASHDLFVELLTEAGVAIILSEEAEAPVIGKAGGRLAVAVDPLDGSSNVGTGAPLGTIFSILPAEGDDPFLVPGRRQIAAGYVSYGHTVDLGFSVGHGVVLATFSPSQQTFLITGSATSLAGDAKELAFNASVTPHLAPAMRRFVEDCWTGKAGPRGKSYNMRWLGALVGDLHRILKRKGLFFYVGDARPGYAQGRLRHVYECNPIAFLVEQAGGKATDGVTPLLDLVPTGHHARVPLVFGAAAEVDAVADYLQAGTAQAAE
ncbi:fructose-bisphosphatase [Rhizobium rhizosphaerae]|uniref:Fructose-1,6-bisphosphatase class 1 n=1 Tax=Xaviernesmea rhizosphaerae TaxID=1672749 RepID=A0A1Q9AE72_9HYPH|nr:class 1 fructose-bisphosphatase [Xaviernesmea rhizosphaerae]OLP53177.1 fructose-bisphosphatase [Xaviernesmea rhizosphaerae]